MTMLFMVICGYLWLFVAIYGYDYAMYANKKAIVGKPLFDTKYTPSDGYLYVHFFRINALFLENQDV